MHSYITSNPPDAKSDSHDFWIHKSSTKYLRCDRKTGDIIPALKHWSVLIAIDRKTKEQTYVIHNGKDIVDDAESYAAIAYKLDLWRTKISFDSAMGEEETIVVEGSILGKREYSK